MRVVILKLKWAHFGFFRFGKHMYILYLRNKHMKLQASLTPTEFCVSIPAWNSSVGNELIQTIILERKIASLSIYHFATK